MHAVTYVIFWSFFVYCSVILGFSLLILVFVVFLPCIIWFDMLNLQETIHIGHLFCFFLFLNLYFKISYCNFQHRWIDSLGY